MQTIKMSDLNAVVARINRVTGSPQTPYTRTDDKTVCNIGNYHLDSAYGGHSLVRMHNDGGGIESIISGFHSKRDLYNRMQAFISGLDAKVQS